MPCRINQLNKKTGVTYVYESVSFWDKEKKQPRNKKICIGRLDSNGAFIPSTRLAPEQAAVRDPTVTASAEIIGSSIILDTITKQLGLESFAEIQFSQRVPTDSNDGLLSYFSRGSFEPLWDMVQKPCTSFRSTSNKPVYYRDSSCH